MQQSKFQWRKILAGILLTSVPFTSLGTFSAPALGQSTTDILAIPTSQTTSPDVTAPVGSFPPEAAPSETLPQAPLTQTPLPQAPATQSPLLQEPAVQNRTPQNSVQQSPPAAPVQSLLDSLLGLTPPASLPALGGADMYVPFPEAATRIHLVIRLADRRVYIYDRDQIKASFPIAVGRSGWETPVGKYQVMQKIIDPSWEHPFTGEIAPPGTDNPLGTRWIGFWTDGTNYIGFHGTPNEASVGTAASHGCIRMYNQDVEQLYDMVKIGTPVEVVP
ncbi:MAG: L,D-transpeptidase family protein [Oculatellaceae cyanobacterium Prado106]|nr:L,D-transpeptidase family protein [Oculatellaceae cyanobacterium Prado106]